MSLSIMLWLSYYVKLYTFFRRLRPEIATKVFVCYNGALMY